MRTEKPWSRGWVCRALMLTGVLTLLAGCSEHTPVQPGEGSLIGLAKAQVANLAAGEVEFDWQGGRGDGGSSADWKIGLAVLRERSGIRQVGKKSSGGILPPGEVVDAGFTLVKDPADGCRDDWIARRETDNPPTSVHATVPLPSSMTQLKLMVPWSGAPS